jgi:hypothetical protein
VEHLEGRRTARGPPYRYRTRPILDAMSASWQRRGEDRVDYVVVERDGVDGQREAVGIEIGDPTPTVRRRFRRSLAKRQMPTPTPKPMNDDSDDDSDLEDALESLMPKSRPLTMPSPTPTGLPAVRLFRTVRLYTTNRSSNLSRQLDLTLDPLKLLQEKALHQQRPHLRLCCQILVQSRMTQVPTAREEFLRPPSIYSSVLAQSV